jgi:hypothetical protein
MICSSCDSNHQGTIESLIQVTSTILESRGELIPLHYVVQGDGVDGVEGASRSGSGTVFPLILAVCKSVLCILCFSAPSWNRQAWGIYIVDFRSRQVRGAKVYSNWTREGESGPTMRARFLAAWWTLFSTSWHSPMTSSSHDPLFPQKMMWQNNLVYLTSKRSLKVKKTYKKSKSASQCKNQMKGGYLEFLGISEWYMIW